MGDRVVTPARTITEGDAALFATLFGSWRWDHTEVESVEPTASGGGIPYSFLTLAISSGLMFLAGERGIPISTIALWGVEKVRFVAPTMIGDTLHVESVVTQVTEVDRERGLLAMSNCVKNQRGEEVLTYISKIIAGRRPALREASHG